LLSIFHEQAFRRVDEYQADAGVSNDEIKNKVNELVGAGTIGDVDN
jgi:hypothetical protein